MIAGFDRYYQIVRCFRDEDLRADRQPEFTQLDIEMSFVDESDVMQINEQMIRDLFKAQLQIDLPNPFPRITYADAMHRYGTDRPDLRIPLELVEVSDLLKAVEFKVFSGPANDEHGRVAALKVTNGNQLTRKQIDDYTDFVKIYKAKGLAYIKVNDRSQGVAGLQSPILKFLPEDAVLAILDRLDAKTNDLIFFGADSKKIVNESLGALRVKVGIDLNLINSPWQPVWVIDFPMFEQSDSGQWEALHHPFTAPQDPDPTKLLENPGQAISRAYDIVLNGIEIGGGSIRINQFDMQMAAFKILGISDDYAHSQFGHLLEALQCGAPPHGGIAYGLDRVAMMMTGATSIRDVIAFPKTQTAACPLTNAPANVELEQLQDLGLKVSKHRK